MEQLQITHHTQSQLTHLLEKTRSFQKIDLAVVTENNTRLILMVACKTVGECKQNQKKLRKFCLAEERNRQASVAQQ